MENDEYVNQPRIAPSRARSTTPNDNWANVGINDSPSEVRSTSLGPIRRASNLKKLEWVLFILCTVALLGCTVVTIQRIIVFGIRQNCESNKVDVTLAIVLLINTLFCIFYTFSGIFGERAFELFALAGGFVIVAAYCIANFLMVPGPLKLIRLCIVVAASIGIVPLCIRFGRQYKRSGNLIYRLLGSARIDLQRMLRQRFLCETLLNFDLQMALSMVVLILRSYAKYQTGDGETENCADESSFMREKIRLHRNEVLVMSIGLPISFLWALCGYLSVRLENKLLGIVFYGFCLLEPAYVVYKIVDVVKERDTVDWTILIVAVIIFGVFSLFNRIALLIQFTICYSNFGKGLRTRFLEQQRKGFDNAVVRERPLSGGSFVSGSAGGSFILRAPQRPEAGVEDGGEFFL